MPATYRIKRSGTIPRLKVFGPNHCTTNTVECVNLPWECVIEAKGLNALGFILDSADIDAMFTSLTETELSCETLAKYYVTLLLDLFFYQHEKHPRRLLVTLHPSRLSEISYEWIGLQ